MIKDSTSPTSETCSASEIKNILASSDTNPKTYQILKKVKRKRLSKAERDNRIKRGCGSTYTNAEKDKSVIYGTDVDLSFLERKRNVLRKKQELLNRSIASKAHQETVFHTKLVNDNEKEKEEKKSAPKQEQNTNQNKVEKKIDEKSVCENKLQQNLSKPSANIKELKTANQLIPKCGRLKAKNKTKTADLGKREKESKQDEIRRQKVRETLYSLLHCKKWYSVILYILLFTCAVVVSVAIYEVCKLRKHHNKHLIHRHHHDRLHHHDNTSLFEKFTSLTANFLNTNTSKESGQKPDNKTHMKPFGRMNESISMTLNGTSTFSSLNDGAKKLNSRSGNSSKTDNSGNDTSYLLKIFQAQTANNKLFHIDAFSHRPSVLEYNTQISKKSNTSVPSRVYLLPNRISVNKTKVKTVAGFETTPTTTSSQSSTVSTTTTRPTTQTWTTKITTTKITRITTASTSHFISNSTMKLTVTQTPTTTSTPSVNALQNHQNYPQMFPRLFWNGYQWTWLTNNNNKRQNIPEQPTANGLMLPEVYTTVRPYLAAMVTVPTTFGKSTTTTSYIIKDGEKLTSSVIGNLSPSLNAKLDKNTAANIVTDDSINTPTESQWLDINPKKPTDMLSYFKSKLTRKTSPTAVHDDFPTPVHDDDEVVVTTTTRKIIPTHDDMDDIDSDDSDDDDETNNDIRLKGNIELDDDDFDDGSVKPIKRRTGKRHKQAKKRRRKQKHRAHIERDDSDDDDVSETDNNDVADEGSTDGSDDDFVERKKKRKKLMTLKDNSKQDRRHSKKFHKPTRKSNIKKKTTPSIRTTSTTTMTTTMTTTAPTTTTSTTTSTTPKPTTTSTIATTKSELLLEKKILADLRRITFPNIKYNDEDTPEMTSDKSKSADKHHKTLTTSPDLDNYERVSGNENLSGQNGYKKTLDKSDHNLLTSKKHELINELENYHNDIITDGVRQTNDDLKSNDKSTENVVAEPLGYINLKKHKTTGLQGDALPGDDEIKNNINEKESNDDVIIKDEPRSKQVQQVDFLPIPKRSEKYFHKYKNSSAIEKYSANEGDNAAEDDSDDVTNDDDTIKPPQHHSPSKIKTVTTTKVVIKRRKSKQQEHLHNNSNVNDSEDDDDDEDEDDITEPTEKLIKDLDTFEKKNRKSKKIIKKTKTEDNGEEDDSDADEEKEVGEHNSDAAVANDDNDTITDHDDDDVNDDDDNDDNDDSSSEDIESIPKHLTYLERINKLRKEISSAVTSTTARRTTIPTTRRTAKNKKHRKKHSEKTPKKKVTNSHSKLNTNKKNTHKIRQKAVKKKVQLYKMKSCVRIQQFKHATDVTIISGPTKKSGKILYKVKACRKNPNKHVKCNDIDYKISTGILKIKYEKHQHAKIFSLYGCKESKKSNSATSKKDELNQVKVIENFEELNNGKRKKSKEQQSHELRSEGGEDGSADDVNSGSGDDEEIGKNSGSGELEDEHDYHSQDDYKTTRKIKRATVQNPDQTNKIGDLMKMIKDMRNEMKKQSKTKINEKELVSKVQKLIERKKKPTIKQKRKTTRRSFHRNNHGKYEHGYALEDKEEDATHLKDDHERNNHKLLKKHRNSNYKSSENYDHREVDDDDRDMDRKYSSDHYNYYSNPRRNKERRSHDNAKPNEDTTSRNHAEENNAYVTEGSRRSSIDNVKRGTDVNTLDNDQLAYKEHDDIDKHSYSNHYGKHKTHENRKPNEDDGSSEREGEYLHHKHFYSNHHHHLNYHHNYDGEDEGDNDKEDHSSLIEAMSKEEAKYKQDIDEDLMKGHNDFLRQSDFKSPDYDNDYLRNTHVKDHQEDKIESVVAKLLPAVIKSVSQQQLGLVGGNEFKRNSIPTAAPTIQPTHQHHPTTVKHRTTPKHLRPKTTHHPPTHTVQKPHHTTIAPNLNMIVKGLKALGINPSSLNHKQGNEQLKKLLPTKAPVSATPHHFTSPKPRLVNLHDQSKIRILCFGDSLTAGYNKHGKNFFPYCKRLQDVLNYRSNIPVYTETKGIVGEMTHKQMVHRLPLVLGNATYEYDWVIILGGTNDILHVKNFADDQEFLNQLETVWQPRITKDIEKLHQISYKYGAHTVLITVPENSIEAWPDYKPLLKMRQRINEALRQFAYNSKGKTVLCDVAKKLPRHSLGPNQEAQLWDDHLHMTPDGYSKMAGIISDCLRPYLP